MSRTRREYNDPRGRWHQRILSKLRTFTELDKATCDHCGPLFLPEARFAAWLAHAALCMGRCPSCKDPKHDQRARTSKNKAIHFSLR
jgi:hypothetical protein